MLDLSTIAQAFGTICQCMLAVALLMRLWNYTGWAEKFMAFLRKHPVLQVSFIVAIFMGLITTLIRI